MDANPSKAATNKEKQPLGAPRRIKALDQSVVNKIAAGEIIVAPVHAIKELIENSVDAGSTAIDIIVKEGGLKLLQITDNGCGINKEDLSILCERFTTSKLQQFEDLNSIATYGFRGEALASISHIAHLTVTAKTKDSNCAWRGIYADGKLVPPKPGMPADPKPTAGKQGTQITVEDLFYNIPSRRRAFRSASEEYAKILDVVGRYAVHCDGVSFSCKKYGDTGMGVSTATGATLIDRIRHVYGSAVANELLRLKFSDKHLGVEVEGMISNANYSVKKTTLLLFINHRSVESPSIKKAIETTYSLFLPKGGHPFTYLSLEIEPQRVDVNVHPTKREVHFLHEDEIVESISESIRKVLSSVDTSRSYLTQTLISRSAVTVPTMNADNNKVGSNDNLSTTTLKKARSAGRQPSSGELQNRKPYENNLNRVDSKTQKITAMLVATTAAGPEAEDDMQFLEKPKPWLEYNYKSLKRLRGDVREAMHNNLCEVFRNHTYVGVVDETRRLAAMQHGVKLYLVDYAAVSFELFYQIGLSEFGNFGTITLNPPLSIRELLKIAASQEMQDASCSSGEDSPMSGADEINWTDEIGATENLLITKSAMLSEYFGMEINSNGELVTMPLLLKGYCPSLGKIPAFLLRLGPNVDWTSELECFESFLRELAIFHVPEALPKARDMARDKNQQAPSARTTGEGVGGNKDRTSNSRDDGPANSDNEGEGGELAVTDADATAELEIEKRRKELFRALEIALFPAFKKRLIATTSLLQAVSEVADLKGLYRIFERC